MCPLRLLLLFRLWLIYYCSRAYIYQRFIFITIVNELRLIDQFSTILSTITGILTFGCILAIIITSFENYLLYFLIIFISSCSILVYNSYSLFEFYLNFEITLFPIFIIILGWGYQPERFSAGLALLIYTITGSLPLFVYISTWNFFGGIFFWELLDCYFYRCLNISFYLVIFAFLIKLPIFIFHIWLPKAHVEAPVYGSIFLAGTLLKLGGIGLIRFLVFLNTNFSHKFLIISLISFIYVGIVCLFRGDIKILIAYSSVAHMALSLIIFFLITEISIWSGAIILLTHGFSSSLIFLIAYILYTRSLTRRLIINQNSLIWSSLFSLAWFIRCVGMIGGPPASTLIREVLGILSLMIIWKEALLFLLIGAFLGGGYSLILFSRTYHNFSRSILALKTPLNSLEVLVSFFHVFWLILYFFMFHWILIIK